MLCACNEPVKFEEAVSLCKAFRNNDAHDKLFEIRCYFEEKSRIHHF